MIHPSLRSLPPLPRVLVLGTEFNSYTPQVLLYNQGVFCWRALLVDEMASWRQVHLIRVKISVERVPLSKAIRKAEAVLPSDAARFAVHICKHDTWFDRTPSTGS